MKKTRELLAQNNIEEALQHLNELSHNNPRINNQVLLQQTRYQTLKERQRSGILSNDEINIEKNKITIALIELDEELQKKNERKIKRISMVLILFIISLLVIPFLYIQYCSDDSVSPIEESKQEDVTSDTISDPPIDTVAKEKSPDRPKSIPPNQSCSLKFRTCSNNQIFGDSFFSKLNKKRTTKCTINISIDTDKMMFYDGVLYQIKEGYLYILIDGESIAVSEVKIEKIGLGNNQSGTEEDICNQLKRKLDRDKKNISFIIAAIEDHVK